MPQACTICTHPERKAIDQALVEGQPNRRIAAQHGLEESSVRRHKEDHLPAKLARAQDAKEVSQADKLLEQLQALRTKAMSLLLKAEAAGDLNTALRGVREARETISLLLEVEGKLNRQPVINIVTDQAWIEVRGTLMAALAPFPEARMAAAAALLPLEELNGNGRR